MNLGQVSVENVTVRQQNVMLRQQALHACACLQCTVCVSGFIVDNILFCALDGLAEAAMEGFGLMCLDLEPIFLQFLCGQALSVPSGEVPGSLVVLLVMERYWGYVCLVCGTQYALPDVCR